MNRFTIKNVGRLASFELRNNRRYLTIWTVAIALITTFYMSMFSSMKEMAQAKFDAMPEQVMKLFGKDSFSSMANYDTYFAIIAGVIIIVITIFAVTFAARIIYSEEDKKSIEFLYSLPVKRSEIYVSKILTSFVANILVVGVMSCAGFIAGEIVGGSTFVASDYLMIVKLAGTIPFIFSAFAIFIASLSAKVSTPGIATAVVLVSYLLGYAGSLLEDKAEWLLYLSPFFKFGPSYVLDGGRSMNVTIAVYLVIALISLIVGLIVYRKRDFNI